MAFVTVNPTTGTALQSYEETPRDGLLRTIEAAHAAHLAWRERSFAERAVPMRRAAGLLRGRSQELARLMALEMGKPVRAGRSEVEKCAWACEHFAEHAGELLAPEPVPTDASKSFVAFEPLGVVLAIMPWNFPLWQVVRFAAPTLMAGNGAVLKHAPNVPGCALAVEALFAEAGLPPGLFGAVLTGVEAVPGLVAHPRVAAVTLTGSVEAGRAVASAAGAAVKKAVLELGGSDPYLVLEDADLDLAADACAASRLQNSGQSCIAAKRLVVVEAVREAFTERLVARMAAARLGDPLDEATEFGPLARADLRANLERQVDESLARGARLLLGGRHVEGPGYYFSPTVLAGVGPGMPAYEEETFGPVASVIGVADEAEAIRVANDTRYGLGAAVFTRDAARGERIASRLRAGSCFVNAHVRSDPRLPFGGIRESGYGRELASFGIREFVNVKSVWVA